LKIKVSKNRKFNIKQIFYKQKCKCTLFSSYYSIYLIYLKFIFSLEGCVNIKSLGLNLFLKPEVLNFLRRSASFRVHRHRPQSVCLAQANAWLDSVRGCVVTCHVVAVLSLRHSITYAFLLARATQRSRTC
jgi:hypothetical protein